MAASGLAFSRNFPCFQLEEYVSSQDLTQHVSLQKCPWGMNLHLEHWAGFVSSRDDTIPLGWQGSVTCQCPHCLWDSLSLSSFYIFSSVYEKTIFILNSSVNVHFFLQGFFFSASWCFNVVCVINLVHVNGQNTVFWGENTGSVRGWLWKKCEGFYPHRVFDLSEEMTMHRKCELWEQRYSGSVRITPRSS